MMLIREPLCDWQLKRATQREQVQQVRRMWQAGIESGSAGPLDMAEIKRRGRHLTVTDEGVAAVEAAGL